MSAYYICLRYAIILRLQIVYIYIIYIQIVYIYIYKRAALIVTKRDKCCAHDARVR